MPWSKSTYSKFWILLLGHFIKHKHLFFCRVTSIICKSVFHFCQLFFFWANLLTHLIFEYTFVSYVHCTDCRDNTKHFFSQLQKLHNARLKIDMKKCILGRRGMLKSRTRCVFLLLLFGWEWPIHPWIWKVFFFVNFFTIWSIWTIAFQSSTVFWPLKSKYINTFFDIILFYTSVHLFYRASPMETPSNCIFQGIYGACCS